MYFLFCFANTNLTFTENSAFFLRPTPEVLNFFKIGIADVQHFSDDEHLRDGNAGKLYVFIE